ncbi:MAG TPA: hypothetical protein EYP59_22295 [Thiotrichaceae bacterium]|nr:hypothetical protein [Thiotrichaceae bacterium]
MNHNFSLKKFPLLMILLFVCISAGMECRADSLPIHLAGFAFMGDFSQIKKNFPFAYEISREKLPNGQNLLDKSLCDRLTKVLLKDAHFVEGKLALLGDGSLTLACCLDNETITVEEYEKGYKIVIDLGAQLLLFDYASFKLVACYPFTIELIDFSEVKPSDKILKDHIRALLLTDKYKINLFDECAQLLKNVKLQKFYGGSIKVTDVVIEDKALSFLPKRFSENTSNFENFVAQGFGKFLSKNQSVSILPYTKGYAIGNKMALRFSNAEVFQLQIPEPQFAVKLTVRGFKKVMTDERAAGSCWVYGSYTRISISQPSLGKIYLDEKVKNGVAKIIPAMQKTVDDWPVFQESLMVLFDKITKSFTKESKYKKVKEVCGRCS